MILWLKRLFGIEPPAGMFRCGLCDNDFPLAELADDSWESGGKMCNDCAEMESIATGVIGDDLV